ncbi:MAG: dienelactone hydrolase family protein [Planctomycetota bacterium]
MSSLLACTLFAAAPRRPAFAKVVTEPVRYEHDGVHLIGYLAYDDALKDPRPGVVVAPEWWGLNDFAKEQTRRLAELGYVALALDLYGEGRVTADPAEAGKLAGAVREQPEIWLGRAKAGLDALAGRPGVDRKRLAAIGFCFGGTTALRMAGAGHHLAAAVSFHGSLPAFTPEEAARIRARLLVLHGAADTHVPDQMLTAFMDSLRESRADWQVVIYSGAKHSFMNPDSNRMQAPGVGYDERTARRAWTQMRVFFDELFAAEPARTGETGE